MPIDYKKYPKNWKWISEQVRKDAGNKCELCFAPNGEVVVRPVNMKGFTRPWYFHPTFLSGKSKPVKIILTVHHIDFDKKNNERQNLIALCQRCHLRLDLGRHMKNRTRKKQNTNLSLIPEDKCI